MSTPRSVGFLPLQVHAHCDWPTPPLIHTLESYALFSDIGLPGDWNRSFLIGNPTSDLLVREYLGEFTAEQLRASIALK